ncbi:hypothetical protein PInf_011529 [Phytophthora infestans]|nr:hypothetical protein PInf_011529 [Phytophthora infestans]
MNLAWFRDFGASTALTVMSANKIAIIWEADEIERSYEGRRGGRILPLKSTVDTAIQNLNFVRNVCVFKRTHNTVVQMNPQVDVDMEEDMSHHRLYGPAEYVNAENLMFILYTSSSTGTPKGIDHTLAAT